MREFAAWGQLLSKLFHKLDKGAEFLALRVRPPWERPPLVVYDR
ncbi:hypothetical protein [Mumia zhuanghuii]|nr:hypothetical protein [Mumia zhuanghuii]